jgi:hypothetical protein
MTFMHDADEADGLARGEGQLRADVERAVAALAVLEEEVRPHRPATAVELAALRAELMESLACLGGRGLEPPLGRGLAQRADEGAQGLGGLEGGRHRPPRPLPRILGQGGVLGQ